jgi:hypothetical protein
MQMQKKSQMRKFMKKYAAVLTGLVLVAVCRAQTVVYATQLTFATPEEAGQSLQAAARANNEDALLQILGPESKSILSSGDPEEDKAAIASFVAKYEQMNRWVAMNDGSRVLYIGADNYPYPIPLAQDTSSRWYFDTAAGKDEILARRIGKNELLAIDAISAMAGAEELYFWDYHDGPASRQYAQRILSSPGKQDGLYWKVRRDLPSSPLGRLDEFAMDVLASTQPGEDALFDGYIFRILTAQGEGADGGAHNYIVDGKMSGGYAILATPVTYGSSGIMTFLVGPDEVIYEKDLGPETTENASMITSYNPDSGWTTAE